VPLLLQAIETAKCLGGHSKDTYDSDGITVANSLTCLNAAFLFSSYAFCKTCTSLPFEDDWWWNYQVSASDVNFIVYDAMSLCLHLNSRKTAVSICVIRVKGVKVPVSQHCCFVLVE